jgi:hypothetical protein
MSQMTLIFFGVVMANYKEKFVTTHIHSPVKMEQTECSETSAIKTQMLGNCPKETIQHTKHGESLKSRKLVTFVQERKVVYSTKKEYHKRNMMHNFWREVHPLYMKYQTGEPHTTLFRNRE